MAGEFDEARTRAELRAEDGSEERGGAHSARERSRRD